MSKVEFRMKLEERGGAAPGEEDSISILIGDVDMAHRIRNLAKIYDELDFVIQGVDTEEEVARARRLVEMDEAARARRQRKEDPIPQAMPEPGFWDMLALLGRLR